MAAGLLLGTFIFGLSVWTVLRSPLRNVPSAHWSCGLSSLWILWTRYRNRELAVLTEKHQRLGPIVRVGPADLSISCYDNGVRTIYNGGFEKPAYYDFFSYYAEKNAFCSLSRQDHSMRRKRITAAFTKSALFASEPLSTLTQAILFDRLLPLIRQQAASKQPTDVLSLSYALSLDLLTCFQFGLASGSNFLQSPDRLKTWIEHYEHRYCKDAFWPQELPTLTLCLKYLGIDMLPKSQHRSTQFLEDWLLELCDDAEKVRLEKEKENLVHPCDVPVVYQLVKRGVEADLPHANPDKVKKEIASELFDQMSGGREVLGLVLAYTIYYISQNPSAQSRLVAEFETLEPNLREFGRNLSSEAQHSSNLRLPSPSSLDKLPYLSAVLKESLRMRPNSTPLPRITPRDRPVSLAGKDGIPPGTRVNVFQWFIHRDPANYNDVDVWQPDRWIEEESKNDKVPLLWAFGGGSRMCVGASLSFYLMRYILAVIYTNFSSRVVSKKTGAYEPGSLEDEIMIQFEEVSNSDDRSREA
ncbi:hypothetical protein XA68_13377 [Ophiocordyceps unilateralis]|uniref:Cytochrome P450 n=1 Tax=Ophiocordyceps unilateralis TaxID=268505 RepID=A0A2A9PLV9_OPHUN|nr:hypothetical protein XA68_13377 [Ophiocordyceps unilateralis]